MANLQAAFFPTRALQFLKTGVSLKVADNLPLTESYLWPRRLDLAVHNETSSTLTINNLGQDDMGVWTCQVGGINSGDQSERQEMSCSYNNGKCL